MNNWKKSLVFICLLSSPGIGSSKERFTESLESLPSPQPCSETKEGCYSHYTLLSDLNGDGHLDLVFANGGGYYSPGESAPLAAYANRGDGTFDEIQQNAFSNFEGRIRQIAAGDVNGDGLMDLLLPAAYGLQMDSLFINQGGEGFNFSDEGPLRLGTTSKAGATRLADVDGDGDLDAIITDWGDNPPDSPGTAHIMLNDGAGYFTELKNAIPQNTDNVGTGPIDLDLFDADGDFDLDILIASRQGDSLLFFNDGTGHFSFIDKNLPPQQGPYVYGPDACDVDGDGDLDLWLDNGSAQLREQLLINNGQGQFEDVTSEQAPRPFNTRSDDNKVTCVDVNQDGAFDSFVTSLSGNERVLLNDGQGYFKGERQSFPKQSDSSLGSDVGDINNDGRLDVITAQGESGSFLNRVYLGSTGSPVDRFAPILRAVQDQWQPDGKGQYNLRFAVTDSTTTDTGPRLKDSYAMTPSGERIEAVFVGGDLFQLKHTQRAQDLEICIVDWAGNSACYPVSELTSP